ncbi:MAG TPA: PEP/pyruvate-binding domain-containing protein [Streptosporangiaceae bacterium]|nr:PEP/pyruvate-binding domain-containing protein [Streptosporangiaceae bacterium]
MISPHLTRPLIYLRSDDRPSVGGKAAGLGELAAAGLPVPAGFAVTTGAFRHALQVLDPDGAIPRQVGGLSADDDGAIADVSAHVRSRIVDAPLPARLRDEIAEAYRALPHQSGPGRPTAPAGDVPVAVRSSATGEDSGSASFAGLQDTYLWVTGADAVAEHVRRCWASLYSVESVTYRRHQGVLEEGLAMGVVVQLMVDPRCAGVLFTRSPVTGDASVIVIEASWGLGSAVVSGVVTPDTYVVSKVTGEIVKREVATKLCHHQRNPSAPGVCLRDVPLPLRDVPCLEDGEILALADLGRRVSDHYGTPQDVEWAIHGGSGPQIVLLQSRPETVWSSRATSPVAAPTARAFDHVLGRLSAPGRMAAP